MATDLSESSVLHRLWSRLWWIVPLALTLVAYRGSLSYGYIADAVFLLEHNTYLQGFEHLWGALTHDYFWSSSGNTIPYWRPVTKAMWLLEAQIFGIHSAVFHAFQLGWFSVAIGGAMALARGFGASRLGALVAGASLGLHPAAFEPVSLLMARSDVIGTAAFLWMVVHWMRWRAGVPRALLWHVFWLLLALGSKESAAVAAPLLTVWAFLPATGENFSRPDWRRIGRAVGPVWAAVIGWLVLRAAVLAGEGGFGLTLDPLRILGGAAHCLVALVPLQFDTGLFNPTYAMVRDTWVQSCGVLLLFGGFVGLAFRFRRHDIVALFVWIPAALAPVLLVDQLNVPNVAGKFPLADRWLFPAAAASSVLLGLIVVELKPLLLRRVTLGVVGMWALLACAIAPDFHGDFANAQTLLDREDQQLQAVDERYWTLEDRCRAHDRNMARAAADGRPDAVIQLDETAPEGCPETVKRGFNRLAALVELKRFSEALPLAKTLLSAPEADTRERPALHFMAGIALAKTGRAEEALQRFKDAESLGLKSCWLQREAAGVSVALSAWVEAARRFEAFYDCAQSGKPAAILLDAARAWRAAGDLAAARRVLDRAAGEAPSDPALNAQIQSALKSLEAVEGVEFEKP